MRISRFLFAATAAIIVCIVLSACSLNGHDTQKLTVSAAEEVVKDYMAVKYPDLNPDTTFPLVDFTPGDLYEQTGVQVFKVAEGISICQSFLVKDGKVVHEIMGFGGLGLVSIEPADFEADTEQFVYTYSWGSGLHHSILELFDSGKGSFSLFMDISGEDMLIEKETSNRFGIYTAVFTDNLDIVRVSAKKGSRMGTLSAQPMRSGGYRLVYEKVDGSIETTIVNEVSREVLERVGRIANPSDASVLLSSSTGDYIKADRADYDAILKMGDKALPAMLEEVVVMQNKSLDGAIMQQLIMEITKQKAQTNAEMENIKLYKAYIGKLQ